MADSGCGVSPDDKEKLFLPYFSTKGRGTGLGLAIVSHIVAEHSAHIRVEDNQPAGRALHRGDSGAGGIRSRPEPAADPLAKRMKPRRILVVDDEPDIRQSLSGVLEDEGYAVEAVESGESCLAALPGSDYELVLLDIWLPGIDGMEVLARIQEIPFGDRPVVVMISGHGSIETAVKATKLGAFDFLEKPLSIEKVSVVVKNALEHRNLSLENSRLKADSGVALPHHRRQRAHEGAAPAARADGRHQRPRADLRRERHRQGTGGARAARPEPARRRAVRRGELRGHSRRADRKRAVRPHQGQLRRRARKQDRQVPEGRRRHAVPGRSGRHEPAHAGQGAARARRAALRAGGRGRIRCRWTCAWWRPPTRTWRKRSSAAIFARICSTG